MGNQLGLLTVQLGMHFKYGSDIVLLRSQFNQMKETFLLKECLSGHQDSFCTIVDNSMAHYNLGVLKCAYRSKLISVVKIKWTKLRTYITTLTYIESDLYSITFQDVPYFY